MAFNLDIHIHWWLILYSNIIFARRSWIWVLCFRLCLFHTCTFWWWDDHRRSLIWEKNIVGLYTRWAVDLLLILVNFDLSKMLDSTVNYNFSNSITLEILWIKLCCRTWFLLLQSNCLPSNRFLTLWLRLNHDVITSWIGFWIRNASVIQFMNNFPSWLLAATKQIMVVSCDIQQL